MLSAARLPQVRAEACISLQASWEWSKVWTVRTIFGELKVQLRNEPLFVEVSEVCSGEQTFAQLRTGFTLHAALQNKSVVCSGSRVTNTTVMKLHESDNRGGIAVKTYTKSTCSHKLIQFKLIQLAVARVLWRFLSVNMGETSIRMEKKDSSWVVWNGWVMDEVLLSVLRCQLTYQGQVVTNAEARFNKSLRPRKPEGSLGRTAQDVHLDSHTAPELCCLESTVHTEIVILFSTSWMWLHA